jgi:ABC-type multidrug transport system fused ATPase/permease subunit
MVKQTGQGLDTVLGEGGKKLSDGEKQRLSPVLVYATVINEDRLIIFAADSIFNSN